MVNGPDQSGLEEAKTTEASGAASRTHMGGAQVPTAESLDYSGEDNASDTQVAVPTVGGYYDPRPHEDGARRTIAYLLIGLLWFVVVAMFGLIAFGSMSSAEMKDFAVILGPVVTLVSAATGFYYGTKSTDRIT